MKKTLLLAAVLHFALNSMLFAQQQDQILKLDSIVVSSYRAEKRTPVAFSNMDKEELSKSGVLSSVPLLLGLQPSVVSFNEGGTGLGYSKMRVRGSDGTRTNVTLNGVTLNDAESQEVFWVNIPSLTGILQSVQLQRGIGTSVNGAGAFGASINMNTIAPSREPYAEAEIGGGSYNTAIFSASAGSGRIGGSGSGSDGFTFDMRYSYNRTDGYIRNAFARLHSLYATVGWLGGNNSFKVSYILGKQRSGITWEGVPREMLKLDRRYNPAGEYHDLRGNLCYYDNETDNYLQQHLHAHYIHQFSSEWMWNLTLNYVKGDGYYENFKEDKKFSDYALTPQSVGGVTYKRSNVIIQQLMDNSSYTAASNLKYHSDRVDGIANVSYTLYDGDHFGNLKWAEYNENIPLNHSWYRNNGNKRDLSTFLRGEFRFFADRMTIYADLQYRHILYQLSGPDKDFVALDKVLKYNFLNPKGGVSYKIDGGNDLYASLSVGHKEPSRSDIKEAIKAGKGDEILPERLLDYEFGYLHSSERFSFATNLFLMEYKNQLLETGKISETGYTIKENVARSYRRGVEFSAGWHPLNWLRLDGNLALSRNRILDYTVWVDRYDNPDDWGALPQLADHLGTTSILMSPSVVGGGMATFSPFAGFSSSLRNLTFALIGKYVGKQFYDNTSADERSLPAYFVMSFNSHFSWRKIKLSIFVDNLLNREYVADAWVYRAIFADGSEPYLEEGFFPQAGINATVKLSYAF